MSYTVPFTLASGQPQASAAMPGMTNSVQVNNNTNQWLYVQQAGQWVAPYTVDWCARINGELMITVLRQPPPGVTQAAVIAGEQAQITGTDALLPPSAGTRYDPATGATEVVVNGGQVSIQGSPNVNIQGGTVNVVNPTGQYLATNQPAVHLVQQPFLPSQILDIIVTVPAGTHAIGLVGENVSGGTFSVYWVAGNVKGTQYWEPVNPMPVGPELTVIPVFVDTTWEANLVIHVGNNTASGHNLDVFAIMDTEAILFGNVGQLQMSQSVPVTVASDQSMIPVQELRRVYDGAVGNPAVGSGVQGICALTGVANRKWTVDYLSWSWMQAGTSAQQGRLQVLDGATVIWEKVVALTATAESVLQGEISGVALQSLTFGNTMKFQFSAASTGTFQSVNMGGYLN